METVFLSSPASSFFRSGPASILTHPKATPKSIWTMSPFGPITPDKAARSNVGFQENCGSG
jgi:hypothetical protein